jgi:DNA repair exonuclease SbcCD ATPase subunit
MSEQELDIKNEFSETLKTIENINSKFDDRFDLNGIDKYLNDLKIENKKIKEKYSILKKDIKEILLNYGKILDEKNNTSYYLIESLENYIEELNKNVEELNKENVEDLNVDIEELNKENEELYEENEKLNEKNKELNEKFEKIENEIIEILSICGGTLKNDILDNLICLKKKLHYNFSLFNILYISCYIIFYFYIFYNFDYNFIYIYILFLLIYFYNLFM